MADSATVIAEAEGYVARWQELLGFQNWRMEMATETQPGSNTVVSTSWSENYRKAEIKINLAINEKELSGESLSHSMLHEMIHLLLAPMGDAVTDETIGTAKRILRSQEEVVVDTLANIIWRLVHTAR